MTEYHKPALLEQSIGGLNINPDGIYIDVTFGGGGHSREIIKHLKNGHLYSFDQDKDAIVNVPDDSKMTFVNGNFRFLKYFMRYYNIKKVDGILADLGVSSHHFDTAERGFSFRFDGDLDMRMNQKASLSAKSVINEYSQEKLADVFFYYGELRNSRQLAKAIVDSRADKLITTIAQLVEIVEHFFPAKSRNKFLARFFQSIRIEVNGEVDVLKELLIQGSELLSKGGRFSVITYHSIEDRIVKNYFKSGNFEGKIETDLFGNTDTILKVINRSVIVPDNTEVLENPRSRSAKLRIAEKL